MFVYVGELDDEATSHDSDIRVNKWLNRYGQTVRNVSDRLHFIDLTTCSLHHSCPL